MFITRFNIHLSMADTGMLGLMLLTSKGAVVTEVARCAGCHPDGDLDLPVAGVELIVGIDRFMSEARALRARSAMSFVAWSSRREKACDRGALQSERTKARLRAPPKRAANRCHPPSAIPSTARQRFAQFGSRNADYVD